jgi:uncharacterized protein
MQVRIADMPPAGVQLADSLEAGHLQELMALTRQGECLFQAPIDVKLFITPVAGMYRVEGKLRTAVGLTCSRCLDAFDYDLASHFHVTYTRGLPGGEDAGSEDQELKAEEMGLVVFEGEEIDFRDAIQEQIILSIPMQPRCRDDCQGLCPRCGANLNQAPCSCRPDDIDPRLAVLKHLKLDH